MTGSHDSAEYWVSDGGQTYGPVPLDTLKEWAATGRVSAAAMALQVRGENWFSIRVLGYHGAPGPQPTTVPTSRPSYAKLWRGLAIATVLVVVLGGVGFAALLKYVNGKTIERNTAIYEIQRASLDYQTDTGQYPTSVSDLKAIVGPVGYDGPYLPDHIDTTDPFTGTEYELEGAAVVDPFVASSDFEYYETLGSG